MAEIGEIRANVYSSLGPDSATRKDLPIGGVAPKTPADEIAFGDQLRRELDEYKAPGEEAKQAVVESFIRS